MESDKIIAVIPARGNSKSIKHKNLLKLNSSSLIEICHKKLKKITKLSEVYCSTESDKIINHCRDIGLNYIKRPKKLSKDNSNVYYAIEHLLENLKKKKIFFNYLLLVQPTSPFFEIKQVNDIILKITTNKRLSSVQTIHKTPHNYHYLNSRKLNNDTLSFKFDKLRKGKFNKQKKEEIFSFGNLCIVRIDALLKYKNFFCEPSGYLMIDRFSSFDLDNSEDLEYLKKVNHFFKK